MNGGVDKVEVGGGVVSEAKCGFEFGANVRREPKMGDGGVNDGEVGGGG